MISTLNGQKAQYTDLSKTALNTLNNTNTITNQWLKFYPNFSLIYKQRPNITNTEFFELNKMREIFDQSFKFLAGLDRTCKNPLAENDALIDKIISYNDNLKKIDSYFSSIGEITVSYEKLVKYNFLN